MTELPLTLVYASNVIVAGTCGVVTFFAPRVAARTIFHGVATPGPALRVVGAFWMAITVVSGLGLWFPRAVSAVLVIQLLYKGAWLVVEALPRLVRRKTGPFPTEMAWFFLVWVLVLPWMIPWAALFESGPR